jgi:hypothetical protein
VNRFQKLQHHELTFRKVRVADNARTNCAQGAIVVTDLINLHEVSRLMRSPQNGIKRPACSVSSASFALSPGKGPAVVSAGEDKLQIGFKQTC